MIIQNIIVLLIFSSINCFIYIYNTDDSQSADFYDCIYHETMFYCRRPNESIRLQRDNQPWNCFNNGTRHSFKSLLMNNVNVSTVLHEWKSGVDTAEEYSHYQAELLNSNDGERYICQCNSSSGSFGKHCEYLLPTGNTFAETATGKLDPSSITRKYGGDIVCYKTLKCDYGLLCLDWRDICDGIQNCMFGYDEENCDKIEFNECEYDEYRCMNGMCIPDQYFLDGEYDCMDLSDEKERFDDKDCPQQLASLDCDDRICPPNQWSCGDGQCIKNRSSFQTNQLDRTLPCSNRRDQIYFCEANTKEKLWTLPNGQCYSKMDYEEVNTKNGSIDDYCTYLLRCSISRGAAINCPCGKNITCDELLRNICSSLLPIQYPKGALIAPYIFNYYDIKFEPFVQYRQFFKANGTIKCRGYMVNLLSNVEIPSDTGFEIVEAFNCLWAPKRTNSSNEFYHQFCHNDSRTFNNNSYHFIDVCTVSSECISGYRIKDGIQNCKIRPNNEEETALVNNSCSNVQRYRFRCSIDQSTCLYANSLGDDYYHCKNGYDELLIGTRILSKIICNNQAQDDCQLLRRYIEASWDSNMDKNSSLEYSLSKGIPFRAYCDTFWDLSLKEDENVTTCQNFWKCPQDKWQCYSGQCIYLHWVLDGEWHCPDASDEENVYAINFSKSHHNSRWIREKTFREFFESKYRQLPFGNMCNFTTEYPCLPINMSDYSNDSRFCIDLKFIGDGRIDCMGGYDERSTIKHCDRFTVLGYHYKCLSTNTCIPYSLLCTPENRCPNRSDDELWCRHYKNGSQSMEFVCKDGTVIQRGRCDDKYDCSDHEDEYMCPQKQRSNDIYRKQAQLYDQTEDQKLLLPRFPVDTYASSANNSGESSKKPGITISPPLTDLSPIPDWCNRGIGVLTSNGSIICFCPPQYHGDQCQYHSDRISVYLHLDLSQSIYTSSTDKSIVIKLLILFFNENQVLGTEEIHIRPVPEIGSYKKRKMHFHYSRSLQALKLKQQRYANRSNIITEQPYSIRIEAYEMKLNEKPRRFAVWKYPIYFDYLPVHRFAKILRLTKPNPCQINSCNQNQDCYELLNQKSQYICLCKANYSGPNCEDLHSMCQSNYCSPKALCQPLYRGLSNGHEYPYCICPIDHIGQRCELGQSKCSPNPCQNGGTCYQRSRVSEFSCECTAEYEGKQCEDQKELIYLPISKNNTIEYEGIVVQYFNIDLTTLKLQLVNQSVHSHLPDSLFYLYKEKTAPEIILLKIYFFQQFEIYLLSLQTNNITTSITEENHCYDVKKLFPDISVLRYHHLCRMNQSLLCFHDGTYLCICEEGHQRAECFNYNYQLDDCSKCLANGRCLKGGKDEYLCLCPSCHTGRFCQFNFESFSFTLDQLFFNDLLSENSLNQRITYSLLLIIPSVFFLLGLINNLFCFTTFHRSKCLQNGIGQYLLYMTIINQINLTVLLIRFTHLTVNISHTYSYPLVNDIMCKISSYLLVSSTRIIYWFSSLIAIERLYVTLFFSGQWLKKPHTARRLVLIIILSTLITSAYELAFIKSQISSDDGYNSMCVLNLPTNYSFWKTWHLMITVINASIPFLINLTCTIAIIYAVAKKKVKLNQRDTTSSMKEIQISPLNTQNKFRLLTDVFIENKEFIVAPAFTLIPQFFSLPFFIASFSMACQNFHGSRLRYLLITSYMTTFIPQLISFFLYISPSSFYLNEWHETKISKRILTLKQRLRISNR